METKLKVKTESLPERCESCHQSDLFDPQTSYCSRCSETINKYLKQKDVTISDAGKLNYSTVRAITSKSIDYTSDFNLAVSYFRKIGMIIGAFLGFTVGFFVCALFELFFIWYIPIVLMTLAGLSIGGTIGEMKTLLDADKYIYGQTDLIRAVVNRDANAVEALLAAGSVVNAKDNKGLTALMYAVNGTEDQNGIRIVKALLEAGADINMIGRNGWTAIFIAINSSNYFLADLLKAYGKAKEQRA